MKDVFNPYGDMPEMPSDERLTPEERQEAHVKALLTGCIGYPLIVIVAVILCIIMRLCS